MRTHLFTAGVCTALAFFLVSGGSDIANARPYSPDVMKHCSQLVAHKKKLGHHRHELLKECEANGGRLPSHSQ